MRRIVMALTASALLTVGSGILAQPSGEGARRGRGPDMLALPDIAEKLNLNDEQKEAWEPIRAEFEESTESSRARMRELRDAGTRPDREEARAHRDEMTQAFEKAEAELLKILDEEQKAEYEELRKQAREERGRRGMRDRSRRGSF